MKCSKCGLGDESGSAYCAKCGAPLVKGVGDSTPAQQAAQISSKFKGILKMMTLGEKILGAGIILNIISFFLPWISFNENLAKAQKISETLNGAKISGWAYLLPLAMLVCLVILYFSVGADTKSKIRKSTYQAIAGAVFLAVVVIGYAVMSRLDNFLSGLLQLVSGDKTELLGIGSGMYILFLGSLMMICGALLIQKENLKK